MLPGTIGLEVSPGAHLAKDEINNRSDILSGYSLEVIDVGSEACGHSVIVDGLVNLYSHLVNQGSFIVGVTGMLCSSVTNVLVPVLSHPKINYLTIAASTSPEHCNLKQYTPSSSTSSPHLRYTVRHDHTFEGYTSYN